MVRLLFVLLALSMSGCGEDPAGIELLQYWTSVAKPAIDQRQAGLQALTDGLKGSGKPVAICNEQVLPRLEMAKAMLTAATPKGSLLKQANRLLVAESEEAIARVRELAAAYDKRDANATRVANEKLQTVDRTLNEVVHDLQSLALKYNVELQMSAR